MWLRVWCALVCLWWSRCAPGSLAFAPPEDSAEAAIELKALAKETSDRNYAGAARRLEALLGARGDQLVNMGDGTLMAVCAWPDTLGAGERAELGRAFSKQVGSLARESLASLRKNSGARIEELYGLARRFPMTAVAGEALGQAGDLALAGGDLAAAEALYALALRQDFVLGETRAARYEAMVKINRGEPAGLCAGEVGIIAGTRFKPQAGRQVFRGMLPFDAAWMGNASLMGLSKFMPAGYEDRVLFASWKGLTLLKENGEVIWSAANPKGPGSYSADRTPYGVRGALFAPAVLWDVTGQPAVVVVRQPQATANQMGLRAFSGVDGKLLWSTDTSERRRDFSYAGLPEVSGRYVYSVAVSQNNNSSAMLIASAIDISSGEPLWQTNLGLVTEQGDFARGMRRPFRNEPINMEQFAQLSEPAVSGDLVIVSPNCGAIMALGRFDGKVRWVHVYRTPEIPDPARQIRGRPEGRWQLPGDAQKMLQARYRCTPAVSGEVVLALPQDVPALFACDRASGRPLWDTDLVEGYAIAGVTGDRVVFSGASISAIEPVSGKLKWKYLPQRGSSVTGPASVCGQTVIVPVTSGLVQLNASDGKENVVYDVPMLRRTFATEAGKGLLAESGAYRGMGR